MSVDQPRLEVLSRQECLGLLPSATTGRLGFHTGALPMILPVAYVMDDQGIVARVQTGSPMDPATNDAVVAFEAGDLEPGRGCGWSVSVTGFARHVDRPERVPSLSLDDRGEAGDDSFVRISLEMVSGWRSAPAAATERPASDTPAAATATGPAAVAETHSGVIFFVGDRAYKLKKPVDLGFLDFRTREARLDACRREVWLNRRLAPDVYLGVADLVGPDGRQCDHVVVMRRMPTDRRLSTLVTSGQPVDQHLDGLARVLADFHRTADRSPVIDQAASRDADADRWEANAAEMSGFRGHLLDPQVLDDVMTMTRRFLEGREPLFERRIAEGRACDGHGDLLADDIFCLDDGPRVLDCLEFDDRLRHGDALADVAFLAMDLERLGRADLAARFLDRYQVASGDSWPAALAHHYIAYRAQVRAKVACVRWSQGDTASGATADRLLRLCQNHLRRARVRLVLVGGGPGTGKSTLARALALSLGAIVLRSDEVRKELAGLDPLTPATAGFDEGIYRPSVTDDTYAELLERAREPLGLGQTVILDATWGHPQWRREAARLAEETAADLLELRCVAPLEIAVERVKRRLAGPRDTSDATEEVARVLAAHEEGWPTATAIDTSGEPAGAVETALASIAA